MRHDYWRNTVAEKVLAAVRTGPSKIEIFEYPGASLIIVTGTGKDKARMEVARNSAPTTSSTSPRKTRSRASWRSLAARASM